MKVSKKAYYGLRAALALTKSDGPLSIHTLTKNEHLPEDYTEKILQALRKAGIVEATKGAAGGYALARPAADISVWDIISVLDKPVQAFGLPIRGKLPCFQVSHCQTNEVWRALEKKLEETLTGISLASLAHQEGMTKE